MAQHTAFVSGSATGLGAKAVLDLAQAGYQVVINYRHSKEAAMRLREKVLSLGVDALVVQGDVRFAADCERMAREALSHFGHIDILIHAAGPYIFERKELSSYTLEEWHDMIAGNLSSAFYLTRAFLPGMRQRRFGRLIYFGFDRADTAPGWKYRGAYAAAKVGLVSLMKTLSLEEAPYGITANMVCPGEILDVNKERDIHQAVPLEENMTLIGRPGTGEDISRVLLFLCSAESAMLTGNIIQVTGGYDVLGKAVWE